MSTFLPGQREETTDVRLEAVELALDHHALFGPIAEAVLYHHMHIDAGTVAVWAGDVKLPRSFGKVLLQKRIFHALLYNVFCKRRRYCSFANPTRARRF
jgi:hypothetical protein